MRHFYVFLFTEGMGRGIIYLVSLKGCGPISSAVLSRCHIRKYGKNFQKEENKKKEKRRYQMQGS